MSKIVMIGVSIIAIVFVGCICVLGYTSFYWAHRNWNNVNSFYLTQLTWDKNANYFIQINNYSDKLNNGLKCFEMRLNYYTDTDIPTTPDETFFKNVYSTGVQFIGNSGFKTNNTNGPSWGFLGMGVSDVTYTAITGTQGTNYWFYNSNDNGVSFPAVSTFPINASIANSWMVDFGGTLGEVVEKGRVITGSGATFIHYQNLDIYSFMQAIYDVADGMPMGYHVLQIDLSKWFTGKIWNEGHFESVEDNPALGDKDYMMINVGVFNSANGLFQASDSLFGRVENDANFNYIGAKPQDYFNSSTVFNLSAGDFVPGSGGLMTLNPQAIAFLSSLGNTQINVTIDLDTATFVGFAANPYGELNVAGTNIQSASPATFIINDPPSYFNNLTYSSTVTIQQGGS